MFNKLISIITIMIIIIFMWYFINQFYGENFNELPKLAQRMFKVDDDYITYFWNIKDIKGNTMYDYVHEDILQKNNRLDDVGGAEYPIYPGEDVGIIAYGEPIVLSQFTLPSH